MDTQTETRDCGDNGCKYKARGRGGMRTNGGCRCDSCPHCGANCDPRFNMDRHRDWCDMKRLCFNCHSLDHADDGTCLFVPGTKYEALDEVALDRGGRMVVIVTWAAIGPVISLIRKMLSPAGGTVTQEEIDVVFAKRNVAVAV